MLFCLYLNHSSDKTKHPILKSNQFIEGVPCQGSDSCLTGPLPCTVLTLVAFRYKSSQRPFLSLHRIRALLLQLRCLWDTSPLLSRPRQPLNGAVVRAGYPVSSPFHDGTGWSQALYLGKVRVVGFLLSGPSFWLSNSSEECLYQSLGKSTMMEMCSHLCSSRIQQ